MGGGKGVAWRGPPSKQHDLAATLSRAHVKASRCSKKDPGVNRGQLERHKPNSENFPTLPRYADDTLPGQEGHAPPVSRAMFATEFPSTSSWAKASITSTDIAVTMTKRPTTSGISST